MPGGRGTLAVPAELGDMKPVFAALLENLIWPPKNGHHEIYYHDLVENL